MSTTAAKLTANEKKFLKLCVNYSTAAAQRADNFSNAGIDEAEKMFQGNRKAAGGLVTSLQNKGMGQLDDEYDQFILSDAGIDAAFSS